jgi:hypothetical protein
MVTQVARPGLQHGQTTQIGAEIFVIASDVQQRARTLLEQQVVEDFLVGVDEGPQLRWHSEGDQVIRHGQQTLALAFEPLGGIGVATLGTSAMIAGVINKFPPAAVAAEELSTQGGGAAGANGLDGAPMRRQQARAKLLLIRRPVPA